MEKIYRKIKEFDSIIIVRHKLPDMDALGSQFGLKELIKNTFKEKDVYACGLEMSDNYSYIGNLDTVNDDIVKKSLLISVDTPQSPMIDFDRIDMAKYFIKIDHHELRETFGDYQYVDTSMESNASILTVFASKYLEMNKKAATCLLSGMITDSGRFLYTQTTKDTFDRAAYLMSFDVNLDEIYRRLYVKNIKSMKLEAYVINNFIIDDNVSYIIFEKGTKERFNVSLAYLKSGTVNIMRGLPEVDAWMTFTKTQNNSCIVEARGFKPIVDVCAKYGGGGHKMACGATINVNEIEMFIKDIKEIVK